MTPNMFTTFGEAMFRITDYEICQGLSGTTSRAEYEAAKRLVALLNEQAAKD